MRSNHDVRREKEMPTYEYRCEGCNHEFSVVMSMSEHDRGGVVCPQCKGGAVVQRYSAFTAKTSRKS